MMYRLPALLAVSALALLALLAIGSTARAQPSFDCRTAELAVEQAICRSKPLAKRDRDIALAYKAAVTRLDPDARTVLRDHQRRFLALRDEAYGADGFDLAAYLAGRVKELEAIEAGTRTGFEGLWIVPAGGLEVRANGGGTFEIALATQDGALGRWVCDFQGLARADGAALVAPARPDEEMSGWRLRLERSGAALKVSAEPPPGEAGPEPPFCGRNGTVDLLYLPARR
ncbi:lysozyme inhibitor LprI family protein [Prosthecomicrobium sp. N25]|uniref:lysozyme inhibitor LprI family protein n=1 Tax=Prosthecomicrobium sp. N25 TaxID=3129254 RepID=UPI003077318D